MRGRVLVVCDDPAVARFLAHDLANEAYDVDVLEDCHRTLERAMETRPDVVVVDLSQPGCDGVEVVRQVRANPPTASVPVVLLSAKGAPSWSDSCNLHGYSAVEAREGVLLARRQTASRAGKGFFFMR